MARAKKSKERKEEEDIQKRITRVEKRAKRLAGVDNNIIQRFWEIVNLFPRVSDPELERRLERFILGATPGQYFQMQQALFAEATPYIVEDYRLRRIIDGLHGKELGLAVEGEYESTVVLNNRCFDVRRGINDSIPVISIASRADYVDAVLSRKDPIKLILGRKIKASHKLTLLKWVLPHLDLLKDRDLFDKYLSYQPEVEQVLIENLTSMGY